MEPGLAKAKMICDGVECEYDCLSATAEDMILVTEAGHDVPCSTCNA
jgi:hypothetical protein